MFALILYNLIITFDSYVYNHCNNYLREYTFVAFSLLLVWLYLMVGIYIISQDIADLNGQRIFTTAEES